MQYFCSFTNKQEAELRKKASSSVVDTGGCYNEMADGPRFT